MIRGPALDRIYTCDSVRVVGPAAEAVNRLGRQGGKVTVGQGPDRLPGIPRPPHGAIEHAAAT